MPYLTRTLDGKGTACMPPNEVRELFWNIKNHPNPRDRSESLSTLFKTILCTRTLNDQRVTDAFGASLKPFIQFVIESILQNESPENQSPAASSIFLNVFQHLMAAPVVATIAFDNEALSQLLEIKPSPERDAIVEFLLNHSCSSDPICPSNVAAIITCIQDVKFCDPAVKCLESLSYSNCNDALLGDLVPILCQLLLSRRADSSTALVLRVLCNMVANDCYDSRALECGLVPCMLLFLPQHKVEVELQAARDTQCLALRVLSSLSSSPAFDSVFCSSGMTQALSNCFQVGERVSCELASRILRNMSIHSDNHSLLLPVLSAAVEYIKRLLAVHSVVWASQPVNLLPPADRSPLPTSTCIKLHQRGDHVSITEDVAIAVENMSSLLMHASHQPLRSSCVSVMHSAPLFFTGLDSKPASPSATSVAMPHALSALASLYPSDVIDSLLQPLKGGPKTDISVGKTAECDAQWQVGSLCTAKCPVSGKFRVAKVVQVNTRSVRVQFTMPDQSTVCSTMPGKFLRAVRTGPKGAAAGSALPNPQASSNHAAASASSPTAIIVDENLLSLCSLSLLPFVFQDDCHYQSLLTMLLQISTHEHAEYRALNAINSLASNANFVSHMCAADPHWIVKLGPIAKVVSRPLLHLVSTAVSIFDSLLRSAVSADQRRTFIESFASAGIVRALFDFCRSRINPGIEGANAVRDTAACVVLSCAAVSPGPLAISWLRSSSFQAHRGACSNRAPGSQDLLLTIADAWTAARVLAEADYDDDRCVLTVERYNIVASSVKSLGFCPLQGLARKLKVNFVLERGCDAGGLTVEWLHLLLDAVFSDFAFFLPVLLPSGRPSGVVRINHSAAMATLLPANEVFRMVGCCLALCLQLKQAASSRFSLAPSALKYIMRAPLTQADLHSEHPSLADVIANISSKTAAVQDEYLRGADMTFTTSSTLADLLELHMSGSAFFTAEQNTCLSENIARVKRAAGCEDGDAQLQAPVSPYKDLAAAAAVDVTHGNLKQYAAGVAETLCWTHSLAALNSMREGFELCMPPTELRHMLADDALAALFVPDIDVCEWRRRTVQHAANVQGGGQKPQFGWFWSYVEQCSQADRAELLSWWTGMLSLPPRSVSGINDMHLSISGSDPSTCNSNLVLPPYVSREQLIAKLRMSIAEKTFGLA